MRVSVIIPVYNGENTLKNTLESLANQTYKDFEIVACIDGSKDNSKAILKEFASLFSKFTILENPFNLGLGPTMNRLVTHAKGEYVAFAEQDDYYYHYRIKEQVAFLDANPTYGLVSGIAEFWDGASIKGTFPGILKKQAYPKDKEMFLLNYRQQIKVVNSCMMFRKSVHLTHGLYFTKHYPSISVDWTYILRFSLISDIYGIQKPLVRLDRSIDRNSVTSNKQKQFAAARELLRSMYYEYPNIISKRDYSYAINTQKLLELGHKKTFSFIYNCIVQIVSRPEIALH